MFEWSALCCKTVFKLGEIVIF